MVSEIDKAIIEISYLFENRYGHLWVGSSDDTERDALTEKLQSWKSEFERIEARPDELIGTAKHCINFYENKNYPPSLNSFIATLKEYRLMFSNGDKGKFYIQIKRMDEIFQFSYGGLWSDGDSDKQRRKLEFWMAELIDLGIEITTIVKAAKSIRKRPEHRNYPPSLSQFCLVCRFVQCGMELGEAESFYQYATNGEFDKLDCIANRVVSNIGTRRLRVQTDSGLRKTFVEMYYQEANRFLDNPEKYKESFNVEAIDKDDTEEIEPCLDFFDGLKAKLTV